MMEWSGLSFHFNLHTTEEDSSAIFSADVETVCEPSVTQHDPLPPLTGEWNCIWLSIGSESSLFWERAFTLFVEGSLQKWKTICVCAFVRRCFLGAPRHPKVTGTLTRCFYAQGKWQRCGSPRGRVYEWPHNAAVGERPWFDGGPRSLLRVCLEALQPLKTQREEMDMRIR